MKDRTASPRSHTSVSKDGEASPRLPNERDESSDSGRSAPREIIKQAKADLDSGKQQTDRGEATNAAYEKQKR